MSDDAKVLVLFCDWLLAFCLQNSSCG